MERYDSKNKVYTLQNGFRDLDQPTYTAVEEMWNAMTHGIGIVFSVIAFFILTTSFAKSPPIIFCITIYGSTLTILYVVSTLYHALKVGRIKRIFRILDHCLIFLNIAGTYTPICLLKMGNSGLVILVVVWIIAIVGVVLNSVNINKYSKISLVCYIVMGWTIVFAIKPLIYNTTSYQLWLLVGGGVTYTVGTILYSIGKRVRYMHSLWHLFVLIGCVAHFLMIYDFFVNYIPTTI